jgi:hypothetical protein
MKTKTAVCANKSSISQFILLGTTFKKHIILYYSNFLLPFSFILIFSFIGLEAFSTKYYLAPTGLDSNPGTISSPFFTLNKAWTKVAAGDTVYLRGGIYAFDSQQYLCGKNGTAGNLIKVWAFPGETPVLSKSTNYAANTGIDGSGNFIYFKELEITGFAQKSVANGGGNVSFGMRWVGSSHNIFERLNIHHNGAGLYIQGSIMNTCGISTDNLILNCDLHHNSDPFTTPQSYNNASGLSVNRITNIDGAGGTCTNTVRGCRFWYNTDNGLDLWQNDGLVKIDSCWSWFIGYLPGLTPTDPDSFTSTSGDGVGFKLGKLNSDYPGQTLRIITNCIAFKNTKIGFDWNSLNSYYCKVTLYNNTAYQNGDYGFNFPDGSYAHIAKNNISYSNLYVQHFTPNTIHSNNSWDSPVTVTDADFANLASTGIDGVRQSNGSLPIFTFLHLAAGSDLINAGIIVGLTYTGSAPDLGAFEFDAGTGTNHAPQILNQLFQINENSPIGTAIGTVIATDPDAGQTLTYSIFSGNTNNACSINSSTGVLNVANPAMFNYEATATFSLVIKVQDNGTGTLYNQGTITINIINVNEPPVISNQTFSIAQFSANGTQVGTVVAYDPEGGQTLGFTITAGNTNSAFSIGSSTGLITVANSSALNFLTYPVFNLTVTATDNGSGNLHTDAIITINLTSQSINSAPIIENQSFAINENAPVGTIVDTVVAFDPDAGQTLIYSILSGNTNNAFAISPATGAISVANAASLNFETTPSFALVVKVQENIVSGLSSQATITVNLLNLNEPPVIANQSFSINENSANGTSVGTLAANDPDAGQYLTYSIVSGNTGGAFTLNPGNGMMTVSNSSVLNFETTPSFSIVVKVQDNGTGYLSNQASVTINLLNVNEAPLIYDQAYTIAENSANGTAVGNIVASDPDAGQTLTYSILSGNSDNTFAINSGTGALTVANSATLDFEAYYSFSLVVKVKDNGAGTLGNQATMTIYLDDINETPVIANQTFSIAENSANGTLVGTVLALEPDELQSLSYTILSGNSNNAFSINTNTGDLAVANAVALNFETTPTFSLIVKVRDNGVGSLSSQATITVNLINKNEPPVANNQTFSVTPSAPNGTQVGTVLASDPDAGQTLTYSITAGNTSSAFSINSSTGLIAVANSVAINYQTNPVFNLNIRVTDNGQGNLYADATITINVSSTNHTPVINNQAFSINENSTNGTSIGTVVATDPDAGQALTFSIISGNTSSAFTINASSGAISVANSGALNYETTPSFSLVIKVQDNGSPGMNAQATITINLLNLNEPPVIANQSFSINENSANGTSIGTVAANDPDAGQSLTYSIVSGNTGSAFSLNSGNGMLTVSNTSVLNFEITPTFSIVVKVQDNGTGYLTNQATVTINLLNVNEAPLINNQTFSVVENSANGTALGTVVASDPDAGQTLTYSILSGNSDNTFAINSSTGALSVANSATLDFEVYYSFSLVVKVKDNGIGTLGNQATMTIYLDDINETPVIANQTFSIAENSANGTFVGTVLALEPDELQSLSYTILSGNSNNAFAINTTTGNLTVANSAALNYETTPVYSLVVKVKDNGPGTLSSQATITVNLTNVNEPPVVNNQTFSVTQSAPNGTQVGTILASDPDAGQILTYSITAGNTSSAFSINSSTGLIAVANSAAINYQTNPVFNLNVRVTDNGPGYLIDDATITINISGTNHTPVINNQTFSINENSTNGTTIGTVIATDPDAGQALTYSIISGNSGGAFAINASSGVITVSNSGALNFETTPVFSIIIKVQDNGTGYLTNQATVTINLLNVNEAPLIYDQVFTITENSANGTSVGTIVASDPDAGQTLTYSILSGNNDNTFAINSATGALTVANSATLDFEAYYSFSLVVKAKDNGSGTLGNQATMTIYLDDINETPVIANQTFSIAENSANGTFVGTVLALEPDELQSLSYTILSGNSNNAFSINTTSGDLTVANSVALNFETAPTYSLVVKVKDNGTGTLSSQATVTVNITNVNEPPVANNQTFGVTQFAPNGTQVGTVLASDPDAGQALTYAITAGNTSNAFSINNSTGLIVVANSGAVNYQSHPVFTLNVRVTDNGSGNLYDDATITINVSGTNHVPVINNQTFSTNENSSNGTTIGTVIATDPDAGQALTYSIISGNTSGAFAINASSGVISVANSSALNFETTPSFSIVVKVLDNGSSSLTAQATIIISLLNLNEPPVMSNQSFSINENIANGTSFGPITASDPDAGQTLTYSIASGNTGGAFALNSSTGMLIVSNSSILNYETTPSFPIVIKVQDNGTGALSSQATITVNLSNINEPPAINDQPFSINENSSNGTAVGTVQATDPDAGQSLTYSILSGNTNSAFAIVSSTGILYVNNTLALDYETTPSFSLVIKVQDNFSSGSLSSQATIIVSLNNLIGSPNGIYPGSGEYELSDQGGIISQPSTNLIISSIPVNPLINAFPGELTQKSIIYPNPCLGEINIKFTVDIKYPIDLFIFDQTGKVLFRNKYENTNNLKIDLTGFPKGCYVLQIHSMDYTSTDKFIIK